MSKVLIGIGIAAAIIIIILLIYFLVPSSGSSNKTTYTATPNSNISTNTYNTVPATGTVTNDQQIFVTDNELKSDINSINKLAQGQSLVQGNYTMMLLNNGNLVLYDNSTSTPTSVWSTKTINDQGPHELVMQTDGNLCLYGDNAAYWCSGTANKGKGPWTAALLPDRNFCINDSTNSREWCTNTAKNTTNQPNSVTPNVTPAVTPAVSSTNNRLVSNGKNKLEKNESLVQGNYKLILENGRLILYDYSKTPAEAVWMTHTTTTGWSRNYDLEMKNDGNLCLHIDSVPMWCTNTKGKGKGPWTAILQSDRNFCVYDSTNTGQWCTYTQVK